MKSSSVIDRLANIFGVPQDPAVRIAQAVNTVKKMPMAILGNGIAAIIGCIALAPDLSLVEVATLPVLMWLLMLPAIRSWLRLRNASIPKTVSKRRIINITLYSGLLGTTWAALECFYLPRTDQATFAYLAGGCAYLSMSAVASLYMMPAACMAYALPMMTAAIFVTWSSSRPSSTPLSLLLVLMLAGQVIFLRNNWKQFYSISKLSGEHDKLLGQLAAELNVAEKTNTEIFASEQALIKSQRELKRYMMALDTAHVQSEQFRKFISEGFEALPNMIFVTNRIHVITLMNLNAKQYIAGLSRVGEEPASTHNVFADLTITVGENIGQSLNTLPAGREYDIAQGIEAIDPDNLLFLFQRHKFLSGFIITLTNVTALRAVERERDTMLEFLTHDLRAPQTSIVSLSSEAFNDETPDVTERRMRIQRLARHTLRLADQLVSLGRAKSISLNRTDADLSELLIGVIDDYWYLAQRTGIALIFEPQGQYWAHIDRDLVQRALVNVIDNAIKYSGSGTEILCQIVITKDHPSSASITVADRGSGISDTAIRNIETGMNSAPALDYAGRRGGGMGLLIVRTTLERHGGTLVARRRKNGGTRIEMHFKLSTSLPAIE